MCGIVGYTGYQNAINIVIDGLSTLEYRGYDSAGIALAGDKLEVYKTAGRVHMLEEMLPAKPCHTAIGHTRWATHGKPDAINAHPHLSFDRRIAVVHNGVIENCPALRAELAGMGITPVSETDSELIAHMLALDGSSDLLTSVKRVGERLEGAATFLAVQKGDDAIYVYRQGASMALGIGEKEAFAASDTLALARHVRQAIMLDDGEYAKLTPSGCSIYKGGVRVERQPVEIHRTPPRDCSCHMRAEIDEIPAALSGTYASVSKSLDGALLTKLIHAKRVLLVGCGTAYHACLYGKQLIESRLSIPAEATVASEFDSVRFADGDAVAIFITQSGETADTLRALDICKQRGAFTLALTNVENSRVCDRAHKTLYLNAGAEIAVAATKSYNCQLLALYMLTRAAAFDPMTKDEIAELRASVSKTLSLEELYEDRICSSKLFFVGKGADYVTAEEGALKFKEITYKSTEAYAAGELKHGTIALIDDECAVLVIATCKADMPRLMATVSELRSRGAYTVAVSSVGDIGANRTLAIPAPFDTALRPLLSVLPLQSLALTTSLCLGLDPDKPRNLAKSVTVI